LVVDGNIILKCILKKLGVCGLDLAGSRHNLVVCSLRAQF
jgi:hypothetical protein